MALTQMQLIQSLGEAMAWLERENQWGSAPTELRHLCGRIGELYAAVMTNGQLALKVNQPGYDVVSRHGERISVKTTAMRGTNGHIDFNARSLSQVDRVIILKVNLEEMEIQTLFDGSTEAAAKLMSEASSGKQTISLSTLLPKRLKEKNLKSVGEVHWRTYKLSELETGSIEVFQHGAAVIPAKPMLRMIAAELGVSIVNSSGNPYNTRQLGTLVMDTIRARTMGNETVADEIDE
jgi:hypothetical protein